MEDERLLLFRYETLIYSDGTSEMKLLPLDVEKNIEINEFIDLNLATSRIGEILLTMKYLVEKFNNYNFEESDMFSISTEFREAVEKTSRNYNVTMNSVLDKFLRQTKKENGENMDMDYVREILLEYLKEMDSNSKDLAIQNILLNTVSKGSVKKDFLYINLFFSNPSIPFILKNGKTV